MSARSCGFKSCTKLCLPKIFLVTMSQWGSPTNGLAKTFVGFCSARILVFPLFQNFLLMGRYTPCLFCKKPNVPSIVFSMLLDKFIFVSLCTYRRKFHSANHVSKINANTKYISDSYKLTPTDLRL